MVDDFFLQFHQKFHPRFPDLPQFTPHGVHPEPVPLPSQPFSMTTISLPLAPGSNGHDSAKSFPGGGGFGGGGFGGMGGGAAALGGVAAAAGGVPGSSWWMGWEGEKHGPQRNVVQVSDQT